MVVKINIAEILKDKPQGTKLYSRICGAVEFERVFAVYQKKSIVVKELNSGNQHRFWHDGNFFRAGQCVLQPSEDMADWSKFAWKKGDILVSNDGGTEVIFDKWYDETYTSFYCKHYLNSEDENKIVYYEAFLCTTERYSLEDKDSVQTYINTIEKRMGGKLNRETLEIEKAQPKFKEGDVVVDCDNPNYERYFIIKKNNEETVCPQIILYHDNGIDIQLEEYDRSKTWSEFIRFATDSEKQQLFDALAKKGKRWDSENKQIVDLPKKCEFKPFDKVLVRDTKDEFWRPAFFASLDEHCITEYAYGLIGDPEGVFCKYCIPYNEETAHLIGTTDDWEGGVHK